MHPRPVVFSKWLRWRYAAIFKYSAACCWRSRVSTSFKCALRGIDYTNSSRFNRIHSTNSEHGLHVRFVVKRSSVIKYRSYLICVFEQLPNPPEYINDQFKGSRFKIYIFIHMCTLKMIYLLVIEAGAVWVRVAMALENIRFHQL